MEPTAPRKPIVDDVRAGAPSTALAAGAGVEVPGGLRLPQALPVGSRESPLHFRIVFRAAVARVHPGVPVLTEQLYRLRRNQVM